MVESGGEVIVPGMLETLVMAGAAISRGSR